MLIARNHAKKNAEQRRKFSMVLRFVLRGSANIMKNGSKIVVIGGGTGIYSVLSGLKDYPVKLTAIISMADDGGSTGVLREEFGVLPPGDIRRALVALSSSQELLCRLFNYRFEKGNLKDHNFGNIFITALCKIFKDDFEKAIQATSEILDIKGKVIPVTLDKARLCARLEDGKIIVGETNIDIPKHNGKLKIEKVYLKPVCKINKNAKDAILKADFIVIGPGDVYTSIIPNLLVKGMSGAIKASKAKKIYICNLMTKFGETNNFRGEDFIEEIEKYLGKDILDYVVFNNNNNFSGDFLKKYRKRKAYPVKYKKQRLKKRKFKIIEKNFVRAGDFIRHDSKKVAKIIYSLE